MARLLPALLLSLALPAQALVPVDDRRLANAPGEAENWLSHGRDQQETRFSPLQQVAAENLPRLGLEWYVDLPDTRGLQATPLVADGVMYVTGNWSVARAYDARNGELLWQYDPGVDRARAGLFCCGVVNRGVALYQDSVFLGTLDGYLVAIDRATGEERWRTLTIDQAHPYAITGAPRIAGGVVVIGNSGSEYGVRGYVSGFDPQTGEQLWRFYTVPGNPAEGYESDQMQLAASTWTGEWWTMGGGGTVWDSMAYDPELDLLYIGTGNGAPQNRDVRSPGGGDNLFLSSIVALRPQTGAYVWHHQQTPGDSWDYTATQQIVLADIDWQGQTRQALMHAPKNGFFFVYDRATGELLSAEPYVPVTWASHYDLQTGRPVESADARYPEGAVMIRPSGLGGHNWHSMAWNPQRGLMYIPTQDFANSFEQDEDFTFIKNQWNLGYKIETSPFGAMLTKAIVEGMMDSALLAWDPVRQQAAWRAPTPRMGNGGALATAGDLVFQGTIDGEFRAYHAGTGEVLWRFDAQHAITAAPVSYAVDGRQYISVLAGRGGGFSLSVGLDGQGQTEQRRLLTFALDGAATLPAVELPAAQRPRPPASAGDEASSERGAAIYHRFCQRCHGANLFSDGSVPDLRRLDPFWYDLFPQVILEGNMQGMGMPAFDDVLDEDDVADIRNYVLEAALEDWEDHRLQGWWLALRQWWAELVAAVLIWLAS